MEHRAHSRYTKLSGLKKLRIMVQGHKDVSYSPFKVYTSPEQFQLSHAQGRPRLLVRTDTSKRTYVSVGNYHAMARGDVTNLTDLNRTRQQIKSIVDRNNLRHNKVIIVHPTRKREDIAWSGELIIKTENNAPKLFFNLVFAPSPRKKDLRNLPTNFTVKCDLKRGRFSSTGTKNFEGLRPMQKVQAQLIFMKVIRFLNSSISSNQIKPNRYTELAFLSWKDRPTSLEFFDLVEERMPPQKHK